MSNEESDDQSYIWVWVDVYDFVPIDKTYYHQYEDKSKLAQELAKNCYEGLDLAFKEYVIDSGIMTVKFFERYKSPTPFLEVVVKVHLETIFNV